MGMSVGLGDDNATKVEERNDGEIPERIKNLPEDDPERLRFMKGQKQDKAKKRAEADYALSKGTRIKLPFMTINLNALLALAVLVVLPLALFSMAELYLSSIHELREEIRITLWKKGYDAKNPVAVKMVDRARETSLPPVLKWILTEATELPPFVKDAQEGESYLEYTERTGKRFIDIEALDWLTDQYQ